MVEITSEEHNKIKRIKRTEDSLRDLWDNIKCTNFLIIGVPEKEERKKRVGKNWGAGALRRPRGMVWGGKREGCSGWGTHVYLWWIHVDVWQNQYNIVK